MGNLALAENDAGDDTLLEARERYRHAFRICQELGKTQILIAAIHFKLGVTATRLGYFDEA